MATIRVRMDWLDALRGIAALAVAVSHMTEYYRNKLGIMSDGPGQIVNAIVNDYVNFGKFGVVLFFCVSGFVIPLSLKGSDNHSLKSFAIGRFWRLYPIYWVSIAAALLFPWNDTLTVTPFIVLMNLTMVQEYIGVPSVRGLYWTLHIEVAFYIGCAILAATTLLKNANALLLSSVAFTLCALAMACVRYFLEIKLPVAIPMALSIMFWASLMSRSIIDGNTEAERHSRYAIIVFGVALIPICFLAYNRDYGYDEQWYRYFLSYSAGIIVFYVSSKIRYSAGKPFVFVGLVSYSLYLFHPAVYDIMERSGVQGFMLDNVGRTGNLVLGLALSVAVSAALYYIIEVPSQKIGRAHRNRLNSKVSATSV